MHTRFTPHSSWGMRDSADNNRPTTEPFATCVAAICRHMSEPEDALRTALKQLAQDAKTTPEMLLSKEATRHGYPTRDAFYTALIPAIAARRSEINAQHIFCDTKDIPYAR